MCAVIALTAFVFGGFCALVVLVLISAAGPD